MQKFYYRSQALMHSRSDLISPMNALMVYLVTLVHDSSGLIHRGLDTEYKIEDIQIFGMCHLFHRGKRKMRIS